MGLFDKVKQEIGKVTDDAKKLVEGAKEVRNTPDIEGVTSHGDIYGEKFPKSPKGDQVRYDLDFNFEGEAPKLIVFYTIHGNFKDKYKLIAEYPFDDIVEFKLDKIKENDHVSYRNTSYYHHIILASGEILRTFHMFTEREEESGDNVFRSFKEAANMGLVYNVFSGFDKITDDKTKQIVNEFYVSRGAKPLFDEKGEPITTNEAYTDLLDKLSKMNDEQMKAFQ